MTFVLSQSRTSPTTGEERRLMPLLYQEFRRRPSVDRNDLGAAALNLCRTIRSTNPQVTSAKFYWINFNDLAFITEGEAGFNAGPPPQEAQAAVAAMYDFADEIHHRQLAEARLGQDAWEQAGRPAGT